MIVTILPITDHEQYSVNGHSVSKDSEDRWRCRTGLSKIEETAFNKYRKLIIENKRFKKHPKSTYKT